MKGLEKIFRQGKQSHRVLGEIDFSLYPGETLGLVGSSGSGKSTLGNCLLKLTHPDRGEIYYSGTKIDTLKGEVLRPDSSPVAPSKTNKSPLEIN